jgi:hypothetical protein
MFNCCNKPSPIFTEPADFRLLSATINDYLGDINDLRGCNNDGMVAKDSVLGYWPTANVHRLIDSKATIPNFTNAVSSGISLMKPGGVVCVLADSCFSGTITKFMGLIAQADYKRNRFHATPGVIVQPRYAPLFSNRGDLRWIVISGCGETQYSADAYINGDYYGAFSYYAFKTLRPGLTYRQWYNQIRTYLPSTKFEQIPSLEGPDNLLDQVIGASQTFWIHNSTHGTQLNGTGDEPIDEAICLYNGDFRDNDYFNLLNKLAA